MASLKVMVGFSQMEMCTKENGKKVLQMETVNTFTKMELFMWANGLMMNNMDLEKRHGETVQTTKESTKTGKNMVKELSNGQMVANMLANSKIISKMEKGSTLGKMEESTMDNG